MTSVSCSPDTIYFNAEIHSIDEEKNQYQAMAIKDGYITALGCDESILKLAGATTKKIDLEGKTVIPGIIDSHMHPYWGAKLLANFSLNYESLTPSETVKRIADHIAKDPRKGENDWLQVRGWLRIGGSDITRHDLDVIDTKRPIILFSNDCHFIALNTRALEIVKVDRNTPPPPDGNILRDANGDPTGLIEDAPAMRIYDEVTKVTVAEASNLMDLAQKALNAQGVTTVMDTRADYDGFDAAKQLQKENRLTLRLLGAREITPDDCKKPEDADKAVQGVLEFAKKYNDPEWTPTPGIAVTHTKLFIDGILHTSKSFMLEPFFENKGTEENPKWEQGTNKWHPYFAPEIVDAIMISVAKHGIHPHTHNISDGAIDLVLTAVEKMRKAFPAKDIRVGMAHHEQVALHQYKRLVKTGAYPVLSFQWCGMPDEVRELTKNILGPKRFYEGSECHARYVDAGARVAFGSDWPIDPLDEWYDFQVACTRRIPGEKRTNTDRNLNMREVITAATKHAAEALCKEQVIGTLEAGKFADFAVLDRDVFIIDPDTIKETKVLRTVIGGKTVYEA